MSENKSKIDSILNSPKKLVNTTAIVAIIGFCIQGMIPFQINVTHGSFAELASEDSLVLQGRDVYKNQGCQYCHTKDLRPFAWELNRFSNPAKFGYFPETTPVENFYDAPSLRGDVRIGPDLSRVASRLTEDEIRTYLTDAEGKTVAARYHNFSKLFDEENTLSPRELSWKIRMLMNAGVPYSDPFQKSVFNRLKDRTPGDALVAYLMTLGHKTEQYAGKFYQ